jgi:hypothetical protein
MYELKLVPFKYPLFREYFNKFIDAAAARFDLLSDPPFLPLSISLS